MSSRSDDQPRRVVFFGNDASRTGGPICLLRILGWLRGNADLQIEVILREPGPLLADYQELFPTTVLRDLRTDQRGVWYRRIERAADHASTFLPVPLRRWPTRAMHNRQRRAVANVCRGADLVYANTVAVSELVVSLPAPTPVLFHIHEMGTGFRRFIAHEAHRLGLREGDYLARSVGRAGVIVVPSDTCRQHLLGLAPELGTRTAIIPEPIAHPSTAEHPPDLRGRFGLEPSTRIVVGCGTVGWRKGTDLFVQTALEVSRGRPDVHFLWIGVPWSNDEPSILRDQFDWDVQQAGLIGRIWTMPSIPDVGIYFQQCQVFLLPSREDPFPLVAIEAAGLGIPVVCFKSSGASELVEAGGGVSVPHLDVTKMADAVGTLLDDVAGRTSMGRLARHAAEACDIASVGPQILEAMSAARAHNPTS